MAQTLNFNPGIRFDRRLEAGIAQGNLMPDEAAMVEQELVQFQQGRCDGQPVNRAQEWQEARQINQTIFDLRHNDLGTMGPGQNSCPTPSNPPASNGSCAPALPGGGGTCGSAPSVPSGGSCCGGGVPSPASPQGAPAAPAPAPSQTSPSVPNEGGPGSLNGVSVFGDPHIAMGRGVQGTFAQPNGLFVSQGPGGQQEEVLVSAPAVNQQLDSAQVLANGQQALPTDPSQTEVYTVQNGQLVDDGTAASLGFAGGGADGQQVNQGQPVTLADGTTVTRQASYYVTFGAASAPANQTFYGSP